MNMNTGKPKVVALFFLFVMLSLSCSATVGGSVIRNEYLLDENAYEDVVVTVHTLQGTQHIHVGVPGEELNSGQIPSFEQILSYLPLEEATRIREQFDKDKQMLAARMQERMSTLHSIEGRLEHAASWRMFDDVEYFVNYLCSVKGIGLFFLFPPFVPVTPILWAGLLIINTNGTRGEINEFVEQAVMMPFVGISVWWVQMYVFFGFAGVAIGINHPDNISIK